MARALFLSPHLDDVVFSCGGLAATLANAGWETVLVTAFTRSVVPATGFALACQLDKGIPPEIDYMAVRRGEDREAARILAFADVRWLDLLEAPHRGYESAPALFGAIHPGDVMLTELTSRCMALAAELQPDLVLAPQGLGNHVDHQQVIAKDGYRPIDPVVAKATAAKFPKLQLFTIANFGGWTKAQAAHFADGGSFDQLFAAAKH